MPKPSREEIYGHGNPFASMAEEFDDEIDEGAADREAGIIEIIEDDLLCYGSDESILGASELDGYFAALACAPETIMPSRWMPLIWGGDEFSPEWESEQQFTRFYEAILAHYNSVTTDLQLDDYEPLFMESSENKGLLLVPLGSNKLSQKILVEQPMIQLEGSRLKATRFVEKAEDTAAARKQLIKNCRRYGGISEYEVIVLAT